jgi:sulfatase modifying factor 1
MIIRIAIFLLCLSSALIFAQAPLIPEKPEVILLEGGTFQMGGGVNTDEKPVHSVTVSSFSMAKYETTVAQYRAYCNATGREMPEAPSSGWKDNNPIVSVTYNDAVAYCNWLGEKYGGTYRLPTEAEWEYAARGGNISKGYTYSGSDNIDEVGWYKDNSGSQTNAVGRKKPNELGLYDMTGNVYEWCHDWYDEPYYSTSPSSNPKGPSYGGIRVLRGGSWYSSASDCRVAFRFGNIPEDLGNFNFGFRVVSPE